jgi:hypothetical protein
MHLRNSPLRSTLFLVVAGHCSGATFALVGSPGGSWPAILSSVGHVAGPAASADIFVALPRTSASADWQRKVKSGATLLLEGASPLAASFGFQPKIETVSVLHVVDVHNPALPVIWSKSVELPRVEFAGDARQARVFAKDRWTSEPLVAGFKFGAGVVLWVAVRPGQNGYERFPYLMQSLADLGVEPPARSSRLWAFFDYSYRTRADPDYLAERWRKAGIAALHVASWHFYDRSPDRDEYLSRLIEACHRHGVLVYAWIELPHVSDKFWAEHPEWREKTALLQDAELDWRKLMNLQNPECTKAIRSGLKQMAERFDWDGVNLAELYFESLEGAGNPARFTPLNDDVRAAFRTRVGWDPLEIWTKHNDAKSLREFLDFRADLARRMQEDWLSVAEHLKPGLDIVLTHVDDRFDSGMRDSIGADAARVLPLLGSHKFSFLIEDPATVWNLGPQRYPEIAKRYLPLTTHSSKLAIDINIVDRYQDVYPTKQQTGTELFELVHLASTAFQRVALYFENSILKPDLGLLAASSAVLTSYARDQNRVTLESPADIELVWNGTGVLVDGKPWPFVSNNLVRLPAGKHVIEPSVHREGLAVVDLNARLRSASAEGKRLSFDYSSDSRAIVRFDRKPTQMEVDGQPFPPECVTSSVCTVLLPGGDHRVSSF